MAKGLVNIGGSSGGAVVSPVVPEDTSMLWVDTASGGILKYYDTGTATWVTVKYAYE